MKTIFDQVLYLPMPKSRPWDLPKKNSITSVFLRLLQSFSKYLIKPKLNELHYLIMDYISLVD